jgi:cobalt/nickel transport protein
LTVDSDLTLKFEIIMQKSNQKANLLLILGVFILAACPLMLIHGIEFSGADDRSTKGIEEMSPGYKPWFKPIFEPQGGEVETFLFATQAAIGSGVTCYILGLYKGRTERRQERDRADKS